MDKSIALYLFVSFVACVTPGSGVLYTIASGFRGGMKCVLASPLGTCLGCSLMSALSATGLGALIANSPAAYGVLQVFSALVLVWFGLQSWRSGALDLSAAGDPAAREGLRSGLERFTFRKIFWGAVVLQASNIMLIVFLLSLMPPKVFFLAQPHQRRSFLAPCGECYLERFFQGLKICFERVPHASDPSLPALQSASPTARFGGPSRASADAAPSIWKNTNFLKGRKKAA